MERSWCTFQTLFFWLIRRRKRTWMHFHNIVGFSIVMSVGDGISYSTDWPQTPHNWLGGHHFPIHFFASVNQMRCCGEWGVPKFQRTSKVHLQMESNMTIDHETCRWIKSFRWEETNIRLFCRLLWDATPTNSSHKQMSSVKLMHFWCTGDHEIWNCHLAVHKNIPE